MCFELNFGGTELQSRPNTNPNVVLAKPKVQHVQCQASRNTLAYVYPLLTDT